MTTPQTKGRGPSRPRKGRTPGLTAYLHQRLFGRITVTVKGIAKRMTVLEAIILQLLQKAAAGDAQARRLLLRYLEFVDRAAKPRHDIVFVDTDVPSQTIPKGAGGADV